MAFGASKSVEGFLDEVS